MRIPFRHCDLLRNDKESPSREIWATSKQRSKALTANALPPSKMKSALVSKSVLSVIDTIEDSMALTFFMTAQISSLSQQFSSV